MLRNIYFPLLALCVLSACDSGLSKEKAEKDTRNDQYDAPVLLIHGGAGSITPERLGDTLAAKYEAALQSAMQIGWKILENKGTATEAVSATIVYLENNPLFNAGKGSVLNAQGHVENDASIMDGKTLTAGAVAGIQGIQNPILAALAVKEKSPHVLLTGHGAKKFLMQEGFDTVPAEYFLTPKRRSQRAEILQANKHGTVGAIALDQHGNLAAGTSTGGMHLKAYGRVGDSPVIGAGTYANNATCAVSCTGHGEYFITNAVAYDMSARMQYGGQEIGDAAHAIIQETLKKQQAQGGLIALSHTGQWTMSFNTEGMFRGFHTRDSSGVMLFKTP